MNGINRKVLSLAFSGGMGICLYLRKHSFLFSTASSAK